jgi:hypothetical protein
MVRIMVWGRPGQDGGGLSRCAGGLEAGFTVPGLYVNVEWVQAAMHLLYPTTPKRLRGHAETRNQTGWI